MVFDCENQGTNTRTIFDYLFIFYAGHCKQINIHNPISTFPILKEKQTK